MDAISYSYADKQAKRIKKFINDPDSTSGVLTVPKVIASGESVTIPAGRVAVLPNVQVDGTLNIEGDVFIPSGATFSKVVETEGNQTIAGIKIFSSSPIVPTPIAGDNSTKVATTAFVKAKSEADSLGVGQTWQNVTASRVINTTYTNTTGKPIMINIVTPYTTAWVTINVSGNGVATIDPDVNLHSATVSAIVPNGATYSVTGAGFAVWLELR